MTEICKEYKDLRMSLETNMDKLSVFVYRKDKLLVNVDIDPADAVRILEAVKEPLVESQRYEDSVVIRDVIQELGC